MSILSTKAIVNYTRYKKLDTLTITYYTTKKYVCCLIGLYTRGEEEMDFDMQAFTLELSECGFTCHEAYTYVREDALDTTGMQDDELFQNSLVWDNHYLCDFDFYCLVQKEMKKVFDNYPVKRFSAAPEQYRRIIIHYED